VTNLRVLPAVALVLFGACTSGPVDPRYAFAAIGERAFVTIPVTVAGQSLHLVAGGRPAIAGSVALFTASGVRFASRGLGGDVVYAAAAVPGRDVAALALATGEVLTVALPGLEPTVQWRHGKPAVAVAVSPDGEWLASAGYDGMVLVGQLGVAPRSLDHGAPVTCVAFLSDGARVVAGQRDGMVRLHERGGRLLRTWSRLGGAVADVAWDAAAGRVHCRVRTSTGELQPQLLEWP
jgi:hypothetical protein